MDSISEEYCVPQAALRPAQSEPVVRVRGLVKRYGSHDAVAGIDLDVRRGEIFAFLGQNLIGALAVAVAGSVLAVLFLPAQPPQPAGQPTQTVAQTAAAN
jgi:ABC-type microcin C transport system duplicated ATPase subunit YejF